MKVKLYVGGSMDNPVVQEIERLVNDPGTFHGLPVGQDEGGTHLWVAKLPDELPYELVRYNVQVRRVAIEDDLLPRCLSQHSGWEPGMQYTYIGSGAEATVWSEHFWPPSMGQVNWHIRVAGMKFVDVRLLYLAIRNGSADPPVAAPRM